MTSTGAPRVHRRSATLGLLTALIAIAYIDRVSVAHAIGPASIEFGWNPVQTGWVLSAFSWGYVAGMIPGGWVVDRIGGPRVVTVGATIWAMISGSAMLFSGAAGLALNRFLLGISEAPAFPAAASVTALQYSPAERGRSTALFDGGSYIGMAVGAPVVAVAVDVFGWRAGFLAAAALTVLWLAVSTLVFGFHRQPWDFGAESESPKQVSKLPFLLRQRAVWSLGLGFLGYNFVKSFFLTWFVLYLTSSLGMSTLGSGLASILPPLLALAASLSVGQLTDRLATRRRESELGQLRGRITALAMLVAGVIAVVPALPNNGLRILILTVAFAGNIAASPGIWALPGDLAPDAGWVGNIGGVVNSMSNIGGIIAPIVIGNIVQASSGAYDSALRVTGAVAVVSAGLFIGGGKYRRLSVGGDSDQTCSA